MGACVCAWVRVRVCVQGLRGLGVSARARGVVDGLAEVNIFFLGEYQSGASV